MTYKTNYELWNPALSSRRPSNMSEIDIILSQTYPHVAMLPYVQCQHCNYEEEELSSPTSFTTFSSSDSMEDGSEYTFTTLDQDASPSVDNRKRTKIGRRLRQLLKLSSPRSNN